jgi:hypothetical protein
MTDFSNQPLQQNNPNTQVPQPQSTDPARTALDYNQPQDPQTQQPQVPQPQYVGHHPESPPIPMSPMETSPIVELGVEQELDPEVQEFMQRVESDKISLDQPIVMHGTPIVQPPNWQDPNKVKLPTSKTTIITNVKGKATDSVTWLANWCLRIIKKFNGQVIYTDPEPPMGA